MFPFLEGLDDSVSLPLNSRMLSLSLGHVLKKNATDLPDCDKVAPIA